MSKLSREELLSLTPAEVFAAGLRDPADPTSLAPRVRGHGVMAFVDQLRVAGASEALLGRILTVLDAAVAEGADPATAEVRGELRGQLLRACPVREALEPWVEALVGGLASREDLGAAVSFVERARTMWMLKDQLGPGGGQTIKSIG